MVVDSMTKEVFYLKLQEHSWENFPLTLRLKRFSHTDTSCAQRFFAAAITDVWQRLSRAEESLITSPTLPLSRMPNIAVFFDFLSCKKTLTIQQFHHNERRFMQIPGDFHNLECCCRTMQERLI